MSLIEGYTGDRGAGGGGEGRYEGSVGTPLEFILTMEGYAVCLAGEGENGTRAVWERQAYTVCLAGERRKCHEGGMGTTAGAGVHSDRRRLCCMFCRRRGETTRGKCEDTS